MLSRMVPWVKDKNKILKYAVMLADVILWGEVFLNLFRVVASVYSTPRDAYYYKACFFFFVLILLIYRGKIINWFSGVVMITFVGGLVYYLIKNRGGFGETYRDLVIFKTLSVALLCVTIICMVYGKMWKNYRITLRSKYLSLFVVFSFAIIIYPGWTVWLSSFVPILCFFSAIRTYEEWKRQVWAILVSGYLASAWFFFKTFKDASNVYLENRFVGNFGYPSAGCYIAVVGIFCIFCFMGYSTRFSWWKWIVAMLFSVPHVIILAKSFSVTSVLAFGVSLYVLIFSLKKTKSRKAWIAVSTSVCMLGLIALVAICFIVYGWGQEKAAEFASTFGEANAMRHIANKIVNVLFTEVHQVFEPHTVGNFFDRLLSNRLSLWIKGIEKINFFDLVGYGECGVILPDGTYMGHPHNSYIAWMLLYGGIRGLLLSISVVILLCLAFKDAKKDIFGAKFSLLWISFSAVVYMSEYKGWVHVLYWGMLILAFPLLFSFREDKHLD